MMYICHDKYSPMIKNAADAKKAMYAFLEKDRARSDESNFKELLEIIEDRANHGYCQLILPSLITTGVKDLLAKTGFNVTLGNNNGVVSFHDANKTLIDWTGPEN